MRAYSQTTGSWLRGILANDYAVDFSRVQWGTFEDGHVAEAKEPSSLIRAASDLNMTEMLINGELDAAIYGAELPRDPRLQSVIPDPEAAGRAWYGKHGLVPVNHMVVVTDALASSNPPADVELSRLLESGKKASGLSAAGQIDTAPFGKEANRPCLDLLVSYAVQQALVPRRLAVDDLW